MPTELTARELLGAAGRAQDHGARARWLARAFLEFRFSEDVAGQLDVALRLATLARGRRARGSSARGSSARGRRIAFAATAVDGVVAAAAHDGRAEGRLAEAADLFDCAEIRRDPLWVEVMAHVCLVREREDDVRQLVRTALSESAVGSADRQRLECVLGLAELRRGHPIQAAGAFNEASLRTGMVDEKRQLWADAMLSLVATGRDLGSMSEEELRIVAAATDGLSVAETAHRLAMSLSSVKFLRHELQHRLGVDVQTGWLTYHWEGRLPAY